MKIAAISSKKLGDVNEGQLKNGYLYNDKELFDDADLNWYDYGFRNYDPQIGRFTQLDPLTDDYPELTPYQYASCEPIANIDIDGLEGLSAIGLATNTAAGFANIANTGLRVLDITSIGIHLGQLALDLSGENSSVPKNTNSSTSTHQVGGIYLVFDGIENKLRIYSNNGTGNYNDDDEIGTFDAINNVDSRSHGKWEDGVYEMEDKLSRNTHGNAKDDNGIKQDSPDGGYGSGGIYRAKPFRETTGSKLWRLGMAIHAGRLHYIKGKLKGQDKPLEKRVTMGCIRTTPEALIGIDNAIKKYGPLNRIIVKNNRGSLNSPNVNSLPFGKPKGNTSNLFTTFFSWLYKKIFGD